MKQAFWGILVIVVLSASISIDALDATSSQVIFHEEDQVIEVRLQNDLPNIRWAGSITGPDGFEWNSRLVALGSEGKTVFIHPIHEELKGLEDGTYKVTLSPTNEKDKATYEDIVGYFTVGENSSWGIWILIALCLMTVAICLLIWRKRSSAVSA